MDEYKSNFTETFELNMKFDEKLEKLIESVSIGLAFSITGLIFLTLFLIIGICFIIIYARHSDEIIKSNPNHLANLKHCPTTCFFITKVLVMVFIEVYIVIGCFLSIINKSDLFDNVYKFRDNCINIEKEKERFKSKYEYCWTINGILSVFCILSTFFILTDIISVGAFIFSKNYNIWSYIWSIFCKNYKYEEVEISKGIIITQETVVRDNKVPEEDIGISDNKINNNNIDNKNINKTTPMKNHNNIGNNSSSINEDNNIRESLVYNVNSVGAINDTDGD